MQLANTKNMQSRNLRENPSMQAIVEEKRAPAGKVDRMAMHVNVNEKKAFRKTFTSTHQQRLRETTCDFPQSSFGAELPPKGVHPLLLCVR